jgi:hypothetical protein
MKGVFRTMGPFAVAALFAAAAFGQEAPPAPPDMIAQQAPEGPGGPGPGPDFPGFRKMELLGFAGVHGGKVVTGAPFTATAVTQSTHTLADGTKLTTKNQVTLYRDSQGRFRKEGNVPPIGDLAETQPHSFVVIQDPVASKGYILNPDEKVAHVMDHARRGPKGGESAADFEAKVANNPNVTKESLGTQTISGVSAQGTRFTHVIPAGKIGNDKPITITREVWYSPDLQMVVQSKHSDPRFGESSYSLTNIQRTEPAASLFTVPSDYTIKQGRPGKGMRRGKTPPSTPADAPSAPGL